MDFLDGDREKQESTENLTTEIISNSSEIMVLLARDGIEVCEVDDYHIYPIADNDTPRLAADRLEYTFANALFTYAFVDAQGIQKFYKDLSVQENEDGLPEIGFKHKTTAREFVKLTSELSLIYRDERTVLSMEFIASVLRGLNEDGLLSREDLWKLTEAEVIERIGGSRFAEAFEKWRRLKKISTSKSGAPEDASFAVHDLSSKVRYIDPLICGERASLCDAASAAAIQKNLAWKMEGWAWM